MNIDKILANEFTKITNQELHSWEKTVLDDYIEHYYENDWTLEDLKNCVADFVTDCFDINPLYDPELTNAVDNNEYVLAGCDKYPMSKVEKQGIKTVYSYRGQQVWIYK